MNTQNETKESRCPKCGKNFLVLKRDPAVFAPHRNASSRLCPLCIKAFRMQKEKEKAERQRQEDDRRRKAEHAEYLSRITEWSVTAREDIHPKKEQTLYILGNGFDLMHRVPSSYYAFRDTLGRHSQLRMALEDFIDAEDIWADFESSLARFDMGRMLNPLTADTNLEMMGNYDTEDEPGEAEFYGAVEGVVWPLQMVVSELPERFRRWVETLSVGTPDRPLKNMFRGGKVLCFNYTEFVEALYGIREEDVCYIHGCRRKKKGRPQEPLILGHLPQANDEAFDVMSAGRWLPEERWKQALIENALDVAAGLAARCDASLTKNCRAIIQRHRAFFDSLSGMEEIICIGHSFAPVDRAYFEEIVRCHPKASDLQWTFGCYGLRDLENLEALVADLRLNRQNVRIFRTDDIVTQPLPVGTSHKGQAVMKEKVIATSENGAVAVRRRGNTLVLAEKETGKVLHETVFPGSVQSALFLPSGNALLIHGFSMDSGVFLFRCVGGQWQFVRELEGIVNQGLLNGRLRRVMLQGQELLFVFNNRLRRYSLETGDLLSNQSIPKAKDRPYEGLDILPRLWKRRSVLTLVSRLS